MNPNEIGRLAHAINDLRPDWPISSLTTFITRNLSNRTHRDAAVALVWVAVDTKPDGQHASETPKRVLEQGPWWQAAAIGGTTALRAHPPKRDEECPMHAGQWAGACGLCRVEALGDDAAGSPPTRPRLAAPDIRAAALTTARDALRRPAEQEEADE